MNTNQLVGEKIDIWSQPETVQANNFKFKSLSNWSFNTAVGCTHGCRFCYVPRIAEKQESLLKQYGVEDPDSEWGQYSLLRIWDADKFYTSLNNAIKTGPAKLMPDGNRAIMFCSTTDPYQMFKAGSPEKSKTLMTRSEQMVRNALEIIRDHSNLNVRILTRSPLAKKHFELFKSFGNRLMFGMSLPTLNDKLARVYEPDAPGPRVRYQTLTEAKKFGLNVYVAMAPTYPECDEADLEKTLIEIKALEPKTLFHEPINIRAENVARISAHAKADGLTMKTEVFQDRNTWRRYALEQLLLVQRLATKVGLQNCLHLWPDKDLKSEANFLAVRRQIRLDVAAAEEPNAKFNELEKQYYKDVYLPWLETWWSRISEWPGQKRQSDWKRPELINPFG